MPGGAGGCDGPVERVTLIPMGAARLRISELPRTGGGRPWRRGDAAFRIRNRNSGKVLGVDGMLTTDSARVVQFADTGTPEHLWRLADAAGGWQVVQNVNSGRVLAVDKVSTMDSALVVQFADNGTPDHLWRLRPEADGTVRLQNRNSGKVLAVAGMSGADGANAVQFTDTGTANHRWCLL